MPFQTVQHQGFKSIEDMHLWMIDQHLGRRSLSDYQRGVLALRKKDILAARRMQTPATPGAPHAFGTKPASAPVESLQSREAIARAARLSSNTVVQIEKIQKSAAPELVAAVKQGTISNNAAAAVASLPSEDQVAAVAGGKKELQRAARRVREAKSTPVAEAVTPAVGADASEDLLAQLQHTVDVLTAQNLH